MSLIPFLRLKDQDSEVHALAPQTVLLTTTVQQHMPASNALTDVSIWTANRQHEINVLKIKLWILNTSSLPSFSTSAHLFLIQASRTVFINSTPFTQLLRPNM